MEETEEENWGSVWNEQADIEPNSSKMEKSESSSFNKDSKVIIHFDIDCFYAQAEMLKNPELKNKSVAVFQKVDIMRHELRNYFNLKV